MPEARLPSAVCAICGALKMDVNHWFVYEGTSRAFTAFEFIPSCDLPSVCGQHCLHKALDEWLEERRLEAQHARSTES
jgi:hypothetical protein